MPALTGSCPDSPAPQLAKVTPSNALRAVAFLPCLISAHGCGSFNDGPFPPLFLVEQVPSDVSFGVVRADLPALRDKGVPSAPVTLYDDTRRALTPPLPSRLSFVAELPPRPVLQFAISVATLGKPARWSPVRFKITVKSGHEEEVIFRETIELPQRNQWLDRSVDLASWSETEAQLLFEVLTDDDPAAPMANDPVFPLWGNPVVFSKHNPIERPPIILISVDCLRPDHMGLYGYQRNTTPRLDEFAEEAFVFEAATAASSWTLPSHMSMMTGLTPSFHAVSRERKLGPSIGYLPELLSEGGYEAIGVVSGAYLSPSFGFERGFHKYRVLKRSRAAQTIDVATAWLSEAQGRDVFLFLHLFDPHWRYLPPDDFVELFGPRPENVDALLSTIIDRAPPSGPKDIEQLENLYDGEIAYVDQELGRLLDWLKERGLYEASMIIITSDHGEAFYEHEHWQHSDTLYEEMIRVPLLVKWPYSSARTSVETAVSHVDLFSTILEAAGLPPTETGGTSFGRYRKGTSPAGSKPTVSEVIWWAGDPVVKKVSLRSRELKYIATFEASADDDLTIDKMRKEELYDLVLDPGEKNNLQTPSHMEAFRRQLQAHLESAREFRADRDQGGQVVIDEDVLEQLRALGYLQ